MPLGFSAAPLPRAVCPSLCQLRGSCITPVNDLLHLYKHGVCAYPSVCASACVRSCCASHPRDPTPWRSPIALSRGILSAAHNRPIACHRDSLTVRKKERRRVRFFWGCDWGGEEINLGETSLTSVVIQSPIIFRGISLVLSLWN